MIHGYIKAASLTPGIRVADTVYNAEQICTLMKRAYGNGAELLVFPELCITGATCGDLFFSDSLLRGAREALDVIIRESSGIKSQIFVGLPLRVGNSLYNVAAVIYDGSLQAFIPRLSVNPGGLPDMARYFTPGQREAIEVDYNGKSVPFGSSILFADTDTGLTIGCVVGDDAVAIGGPCLDLCREGALVLVNPYAEPYRVGANKNRRNEITVLSGQLLCGIIGANAGEGESTQDLVFGGERLIAEAGSLITRSASFTQGITYGELDMDIIRGERLRSQGVYEKTCCSHGCGAGAFVIEFPAGLMDSIKGLGEKFISTLDISDRIGEKIGGKLGEKLGMSQNKPQLAGQTDNHTGSEYQTLKRRLRKSPFIPEDGRELARRCEEILTVQALGLKKRLLHIGAQKAVIGVSGGLDSTLALLVAARAFDMAGLERAGIIAVTMPGFGTTDRTHDNACTLAETLGLTLREVSIANAVRGHFEDIGQDIANHDVTYENSQARERTQILMDMANMENALMVGTGDLSELALGWATYNGDHMSMYGVNGGVPKTLIRHIVRHYAQMCADSSKPEDKELSKALMDILDTPVSPELLPPEDGEISQKTEDLVGPYELHDFFLYHMLRYGFSPSKLYFMACIAFDDVFDGDTVKKWLGTFIRRFFSQQYKRSCLPDGPAIGSVGISPRGGLMMPSDACAGLWMAEVSKL